MIRTNRRRDDIPRYSIGRRSAAPLWLWIGTALFIVYAATIPFNLTLDPHLVAENLARVTFDPVSAPGSGRQVSIPDTVQNLLLFFPFGAFGFLMLRRRLSPLVAILTGTALAALLGATVEVLQLFTTDRTTSVSDLMANTLGALGGALAMRETARVAARLFDQLSARHLFRPPAFYPMMVAAFVTVVGAWEPFDFTLDVGAVAGKLRALSLDPWQFGGIRDEGVEGLRYMLLALAAALWLRQLGSRRPVIGAAVLVATLAVGLEASQCVIGSRMPGVEDAAAHTLAAIAGAALSAGWPFGWSRARWSTALAVATLLASALQQLSPFTFASGYRTLALFPFLAYYERTSFETLSHALELLIAYMPLGFSLAFSIKPRGLWLGALAGALVVAGPVEVGQGWVLGRYPDITDIAVAVLGALAGAWLGGPGAAAFERWQQEQAHRMEIVPPTC